MAFIKKATVIIISLGIFAAIYSFIEPYWIKIKQIDFKNNDIPYSFDNKKIVFIADIHHGPFFSLDRVKKVVTKINSLNPDIVLLGGDYVHRKQKYIEPVFLELSKIKSVIFIGGVLGNHDHWESKLRSIAEMKKAKITYLDNFSSWISIGNEKIKIGGIGDLWEDEQLLENTIKNVKENDFVILISHNPDYFQKIINRRVDLVLSGHTHGGQINFFGLFAPILPIRNKSTWKGLCTNNFSTLYITTGIGTITPPIRFFSRPEIVLFKLQQKKPF